MHQTSFCSQTHIFLALSLRLALIVNLKICEARWLHVSKGERVVYETEDQEDNLRETVLGGMPLDLTEYSRESYEVSKQAQKTNESRHQLNRPLTQRSGQSGFRNDMTGSVVFPAVDYASHENERLLKIWHSLSNTEEAQDLNEIWIFGFWFGIVCLITYLAMAMHICCKGNNS